MSFESDFINPSSEFRGKPFWAWNGKLEKNELLRQLEVFKEMGMGGAFMHARVGLNTPYLSDEWFDLIGACVQKAKDEGLQAWLYDEDRWPSGAAGGFVTKEERFRMRSLRINVISDLANFKADGTYLAIFIGKVSGREATGIRRLQSSDAIKLKNNESLLVFSDEVTPCSPWYNGYTYIDTMNEEAVDKFIEITHSQYLKHNGKEFGKTIPGIFSDEPDYGCQKFYNCAKGSGTAQWTGALPEKFAQRYGYDLLDHLPEIFFRVDGVKFSPARRDYRDCLTTLFVNTFGRKIYEFCKKTGIEFTGHVMQEATLVSQTQAVGAAMRFYEYMQAPGIDILRAQGLQRKGGAMPEFSTAKQCESMRRQFGRKRMLSEMYGCTGWNLNFAEHKAIGDWQAVLGVNLRCHHLAWYTMEGEAKRDYPASISFQSAWSKEYRSVEDYFSRVNVALSQGDAVRDVAVLHPIESAWGTFIGADEEQWNWMGNLDSNNDTCQLDSTFEAVQNTLLKAHCDFDFIDEEIISRYGSVNGATLKVNLASYKAIVIPPLFCVRESTAVLLTDFVKAGGLLFVVESPDELAVIEPNGALARIKKFAQKVALSALPAVLEKSGIARIAIRTEDGQEYADSLYMLRHDPKTNVTVVFITHSMQDKSSGKLAVEIPACGKVYELNAATGHVYLMKNVSINSGTTIVSTSLDPCGSRLFIIDGAGSFIRNHHSEVNNEMPVSSTLLNVENCSYSLSEPNAIALDMAEVKIGEHFNGPFEILKLDRVVRDALGLPYRSGYMVQPWARKPEPEVKNGRSVDVSFYFKINSIPTGNLWMVIERPGEYQCQVNEHNLSLAEDGWWLDKSFRKIILPSGVLVKGWNRINLSTEYTAESGFESIYLLGDFGAKRDEEGHAVLTPLPETLGIGDWSQYNLESFTGALSYITETEITAKNTDHIYIQLGKWEGVTARIMIDGNDAGVIAWAPYELDITPFISGKQKIKIEIKLYAGRRNLLGPLHLSERNPGWTGPSEFVAEQKRWSAKHVNVVTGLLEAPRLIIKHQ